MEFNRVKTTLTAFLLATTALATLASGVLAQTPPPAAVAPLTPQQPMFDLSQLPATHGTVRFFTMTPHGDVDGFVLADGTMLEDGTVMRLPPPEATRLAALLAPGQSVVAQGPGIANNLGRMVDVRAIGTSHDQLTQVRPLHPPGDDHRGSSSPPPGTGAAPADGPAAAALRP